MSFRTHGNILEHVTINTDIMPNTSAAATSLFRYDMTDYDKAVFSIGIYSTARSSATAVVGQATAWVKESSDSTGAVTIVATLSTDYMPGQAAASVVKNAKIVDFVMVSTGTTEGDVIIVNGVTFTYTTSTANLAASAASGRYFGHDGALGSAGLATLTLQSLATIMRNATYGLPGVIDANFSFPTTSILEIMVTDTASTYLTVQTTAVPLIAPWFVYGEAHIEVHADDMTTGEKYLSLAISTQDQNVAKTISVVRTGRRAGGVADHHHGRFIKST